MPKISVAAGLAVYLANPPHSSFRAATARAIMLSTKSTYPSIASYTYDRVIVAAIRKGLSLLVRMATAEG